MARDRIVGQCNAADFAFIDHLVGSVIKAEDIDTSSLKHKQQLALLFANETHKKGIGWGLVREVVTEVLFWGDKDKMRNIEIRLTRHPLKIRQVDEFKRLWEQHGQEER
ncbi:unnamed protein product [marine sediment metagenome]|uniref:Uncharacterized protein n=1 Tax=marine sediment metagenome TaxID=412755 RepID=X1G3C5_9ZZZZ